MSLTKQQLQQLNNTNFPNNTTGYITPALLRDFNSQSVDSMALQTQVDSLSSSFQSQLNGLEDFSSSLVTNFATVTQLNASSSTLQSNINGKASTGSVNTLSQSVYVQFSDQSTFNTNVSNTFTANETKFNAYTQSNDTAVAGKASLSQDNYFVGNQYVNGKVTVDGNISASGDIRAVGNVYGANLTGSFVSSSTFSSFSSSVDSRLDSLESWSSSLDVTYATDAQLNASSSTLQSNINTLSSSIFQTDATQSNNIASNSSSVGLLQTFSGSQYKNDSSSFDSRILAITSSGGNVSVQEEGSILGNATSFNFIGAGVTTTLSSGTASVTIPGGGSINTGSFATTGSNTFIGNQIVSGNINLSENSNLTVANGGVTKLENTWVKALITTSSVTINAGGLISTGSIVTTNDVIANGNISASGNVIGTNILTFATTGSNTFTGQQTIQSNNITFNTTGSSVSNGLVFPNSKIYQNNFLNFEANDIGVDFVVAGTTAGTNLNFRNTSTSGQIQITAQSGAVSLSGSQVNLNGVDFIPFSSSVNSRILASIINTSSFATTGSNSFVGNQTITGNLYVSSSNTSDVIVNGQIFVSSSATTGATAPKITISGSAGTTTINRNSVITRNATNSAALNPQAIFASILATSDEIGFSVDAAGGGLSGWTTGPAIYVNNTADDTYPAAFGFQDKANYTDGRVTVLTPLVVSQSMDFYAHGHKQFNVGSFYSTVTQSGSAAVSQSMQFNTTDISNGITMVSGSQFTFANAGVYNIQFSAQILADTGADDVWVWLKKNGTNIPDTAGRVTLANNDELMAAWNYVVSANANDNIELVWQSTNGDAVLLYNAATGNIPAVTSVIATVTQVR